MLKNEDVFLLNVCKPYKIISHYMQTTIHLKLRSQLTTTGQISRTVAAHGAWEICKDSSLFSSKQTDVGSIMQYIELQIIVEGCLTVHLPHETM